MKAVRMGHSVMLALCLWKPLKSSKRMSLISVCFCVVADVPELVDNFEATAEK